MINNAPHSVVSKGKFVEYLEGKAYKNKEKTSDNSASFQYVDILSIAQGLVDRLNSNLTFPTPQGYHNNDNNTPLEHLWAFMPYKLEGKLHTCQNPQPMALCFIPIV